MFVKLVVYRTVNRWVYVLFADLNPNEVNDEMLFSPHYKGKVRRNPLVQL